MVQSCLFPHVRGSVVVGLLSERQLCELIIRCASLNDEVGLDAAKCELRKR